MSKPTAVQFYGVMRDGQLYRVNSETAKSFLGSFHWGKGDRPEDWSTPARRHDVRFALRLSTLEAAQAAKAAILAMRSEHSDAESALAKANRQQLDDLIAKLAAKGG